MSKTTELPLQTPEEARAGLARKGDSVSGWALRNGFNPNAVFNVLSGRTKCVRGNSHKIAILLRIKDGEIVD